MEVQSGQTEKPNSGIDKIHNGKLENTSRSSRKMGHVLLYVTFFSRIFAFYIADSYISVFSQLTILLCISFRGVFQFIFYNLYGFKHMFRRYFII